MPVATKEPWASDDNYPAGSDPWSGEPTKVVPDVAIVAGGHVPNVVQPSETENWWKNRTDGRLDDIENRRNLPFFHLHQNWTAPMRSAWTEVTDGAATVTRAVGPDGGDEDFTPGIWMRLTVLDLPDVAALYSETLTNGVWPDNLVGHIEFRVLGTNGAGSLLTDDVILQVGLFKDSEAADVTSTRDFVKIYFSNDSPNWIFRTGSTAGVSTDTDTGVEVTETGTIVDQYKVRIEIYGGDSPGGDRVECYINDVLVATNTTNLPANATDSLVLGVVLASNAANANAQVWISPITYVVDLIE
jgi:hypothetical protein